MSSLIKIYVCRDTDSVKEERKAAGAILIFNN